MCRAVPQNLPRKGLGGELGMVAVSGVTEAGGGGQGEACRQHPLHHPRRYQILETLDFTSERRRMGMVLRNVDTDRLILILKVPS